MQAGPVEILSQREAIVDMLFEGFQTVVRAMPDPRATAAGKDPTPDRLSGAPLFPELAFQIGQVRSDRAGNVGRSRVVALPTLEKLFIALAVEQFRFFVKDLSEIAADAFFTSCVPDPSFAHDITPDNN